MKKETTEMTLEQAMTHCFNDEKFPLPGEEKRKWFDNKEAAEIYSESLKDLWEEGLGQIYGPFVSYRHAGVDRWYEVSYK